MRIGVMLPVNATSPEKVLKAIEQAERAGYASAWLAQTFTLDALSVLAMAGMVTERIELGTYVVPTYPRHPTVMAQQALTVQAATGGRLALGIGLSHRTVIEGTLGLDYSRPIPHTREYLTVLNALLEGGEAAFEGELYSVKARISLPEAPKPPVLVAALGPDMLRLCGRLADGTIVSMGGLAYYRDFAVPIMSAAAAKASRPAPRIVAGVPIMLTRDVEAARQRARQALAMYSNVPSYRATLDRGGLTEPGDVAVLGDEAEIRSQLHAFERAGVSDVIVSFLRSPEAGDGTYELMAELAGEGAMGR